MVRRIRFFSFSSYYEMLLYHIENLRTKFIYIRKSSD